MQPIQLFDTASSSYTYLLFDPDHPRSSDHRPGRRAARTRHGRTERARLAAGVVGRNPCPCGPHHQRRRSWPNTRRRATAAPEGCGIGTASVQLKHGDVLRFGGEQLKALHTPGHTAGSMCYLWRGPCLHGRHPAHQWLRANGLPIGQRRGPVPQPDGDPFSPARRDRGLARPRLPGAQQFHHRGRENRQCPGGRQDAGRIQGHHGRAQPAQTQTPGRGRPRQSPLGPSPRCGRGCRPQPRPPLAMPATSSRNWPANGGKRAMRSWSTCAPMPSASGSASCPAPFRCPGSSGPAWQLNDGFDEGIKAAVPPGKKAVLFCRSGVRSMPLPGGPPSWASRLQRPRRLRGRPRRERPARKHAGAGASAACPGARAEATRSHQPKQPQAMPVNLTAPRARTSCIPSRACASESPKPASAKPTGRT